MGKQGPCCHCGVTSTPLWRNGPPEKPVLCNACGSRWRTKGSLMNYIPLHARESFNSDELEVPKIKRISFKPKEQKLQKKRHSNSALELEREMKYCDQNFRKILEADTSNRSCSDSAISGSESCVYFGTTDAKCDLTGSAQSNAWDSLVPSKKRTFITRLRPKPSPVEKLTRDLYSILHEEQASNLSRTSEDDLLYESGTPFGSSEIGYGGLLIKHPNARLVEEESEASSLPVDRSYIISVGYSGSASIPVNTENKGSSILNPGTDTKKSTAQMTQESAKRDKISHQKLNILQDRNSPLSSADLHAFINFESFMKYLTCEEQQQLMKYLPSIDTAKSSESLRNMFTSPQFLETLSYYQQLHQEGVFDLSLSGANAEECRTLKRLVLLNCTNHKWSECYQKIKDAPSNKKKGNAKLNRKNLSDLSKLASLKRHHERQNENYPENKSTMTSPKRMCRSEKTNPPSRCSTQLEPSVISSVNDDIEDFVDHEGSCFSSRRNFASPPDRSSLLAPTLSSESDLLLVLPSGGSFPQEELLYQ
ncbi:unnamed protein product [Musa acuminata var. zebrina]